MMITMNAMMNSGDDDNVGDVDNAFQNKMIKEIIFVLMLMPIAPK